MRRILISSVLLLAFLCYSNAEVEAQTQDRTTTHQGKGGGPIQDAVGFGARGGYFISDDAETGAWFAGVHSRFRFGPVFGLEVALDYQGQQQFELENGDLQGEERDVRTIPVTASALIHAPLSNYFVPYGIAGGGLYFTFEEFDDLLDLEDETSINPGFHLGAGLEIPASQNIAVHGDWRYLFLEDALEENVDFDEQVLSGSVFTFGITFYFANSDDRRSDNRRRR